MSAQQELEKLQAMRADLEAESNSLKEQQSYLENNVLSLEEKIASEELKQEKAAIEELKDRNKAAKDAIAKLEAKKKKLENKLEDVAQLSEAPDPVKKEKAKKAPAQPEEAKPAKAPEKVESEGTGITITAIDGEILVEEEQVEIDSPKQEKKKRRFF